MNYHKLSLILVFILALQFIATTDLHADDIWSTMSLASSSESSGDYDQAVIAWINLVDLYDLNPQKMDWTNYAMFLEKIGNYYAGLYDPSHMNRPLAVTYYDRSADAYAEAKLTWGIVQTTNKANALRVDIRVYMETSPLAIARTTSSNYVPSSGAYLGMYAERDRRLVSNGHVDPDKQAETFGKHLPIQLLYSTFNVSSFPTTPAKEMAQIEGSLQIAMEPSQGLDMVTDNTYIRNWAQAAKASGIPIFLRFGGEMNGEWVAWGLEPEAFIEKFRLIHDIMAEEAPNVMMLWSPNDIPYLDMMDYYPGDDYVDWVGISTYCTPDGNAHSDLSNYNLNPIRKIQPIYDAFAGKKPIMLSESAVAYQASNFPSEDFSHWYAINMAKYYHYIPRLFPEIKAIVYFNHQETYNSYQLSDNSQANDVYKNLISSDYYLTDMNDYSPIAYDQLNEQVLEKAPINFSCYASIYDPFISRVEYFINDNLVKTSTSIPYTFTYDFSDYTGLKANLDIKVYDASNHLTAIEQQVLSFGEGTNVIVLQIDEPTMLYNGVRTELDPGNTTSPVIINNRTMIPIRAIVEQMGGDIQWLQSEQRVTILQGGQSIHLWINASEVMVNDIPETLDTSPVISKGRTLLPVRFISETLGATVKWDGEDKTITITY